jgi:hypothetical protein
MRLGNERGNVLVTSIVLLAGMMMIGLATISFVDTQTGASRKERERESTFNLTEGVLTSQTFVLGRNGTGSETVAFPDQCTPQSTDFLCPSPAELARTYDSATQVDFGPGTTWVTSVRDNEDPSTNLTDSDPNNDASDFYHASLTGSCGPAADTGDHIYCWDKNHDDQLWVRAEATARGRTRTIVALIKVERRPINFPQFALLGGSFQTSNNGRKVIVDANGSQNGVAVRCTLSGSEPAPEDPCLGYDPGKGQLSPPGAYGTGYPNQPAVESDDLIALEDTARSNGTLYEHGCPANPNGDVVYVKSGDCSYNNSAPAAPGMSICCNSPGNPGLYVIENGSISLNGNIEFHGLIYAANNTSPQSSGVLVQTGGTALVKGGVIIDGPGRMLAGSSGQNIDFELYAFSNISTIGTAGVVQNTWRELPAD